MDDGVDWAGLTVALAAGAFIMSLFTAIDRLILPRQNEKIRDFAKRWFAWFDHLTLPDLPRVTIDLVDRYSDKVCSTAATVAVGPFLVGWVVLPWLDEETRRLASTALSIAIQLTLVLALTTAIIAAIGPWRSRVVGVGLVAALAAVAFWLASRNGFVDYNAADLIDYDGLIIALIAALVLLYVGVLLVLLLLYWSFQIFRATTCQFLEVTATKEKETIFAHLGVFVGLLVAGCGSARFGIPDKRPTGGVTQSRCSAYATTTIRARRRSRLARPYICRLSVFRRLI